MTQSEWLIERTRLSAELDQADTDWTGFRARGEWDDARTAQARFYRLRDSLAAHDRREPAKLTNEQDGRDLSLAEWQAESDRMARELAVVDAEWKVLRDKGQWEIAREAQARYHLLRKQQAAHERRMPAH
jgi:Mg-chelatase subunit ChlD